MRIISWNINGIRAVWDKGFKAFFREADADVFCVQEIRSDKDLDNYHIALYDEYFYPSNVKGYAGVGIYTKIEPISVTSGMGIKEHNGDGRVLTLELKDKYIITAYAPTAGLKLERLDYRMRWQADFNQYVAYRQKKKPVIICGDLNVAPETLDAPLVLCGDRTACLTFEERNLFAELESQGLIDAWRAIHQAQRCYTWWPQGTRSRHAAQGLRLDYFLIDDRLAGEVESCDILQSVWGSDHCPVMLTLK